MSYNRFVVVGNLGKDAELAALKTGTAVCKFSIATSEKVSGELVTTWFRVTLFGKLAESVASMLTKGKQVLVDGRLRISEYTDKDGNKRTSAEIIADSVNLLGKKEDAAPAAESVASSTDDDEIPF